MDSSSSSLGPSPSAGSNATRCAEHILSYGPVEKVLLGVVLCVLTLSTACGNLLVVTSVLVVKKLRQPSNYLLVSLALADLSVALCVMPLVSVTELTGGRWLFGRPLCNVFIATDVTCCTASILTLCVISIDRYLGITKPLTYPVRQSGRGMSRMMVCVWLLSASITLPPLFGWAHNVNDGQVCLISQDRGYTVYSTAVAFYIPTVVMLFMYQRIYSAARRSARKHAIISPAPREEGAGPEGGGVEEEEETPVLGGRGEMMMMMETNQDHLPHAENQLCQPQNQQNQLCQPQNQQNQLCQPQNQQNQLCQPQNQQNQLCQPQQQHRALRPRRRCQRNGSVFRREQKAAATLGVLVGAFTVCWLPFFLVSAARPFVCAVDECSCVPLWLERTLLWLGYANSLINPLVYAFFNRELRSTYSNLLRCRCRNINRKMAAAGMHEALRLSDLHT